MSVKCLVEGRHITPCAQLSSAIEYGNPTPKSKGVFMPERVNINTGEKGTDLVQIHSGAYVGRGIVACYCPFCGESLNTWSKNNEC